MKTRAILMAAAMTLTALASTRVAQAQDLVVTVPFDFAAGSANLPAGDYSVRAGLPNTHAIVLINRNDTSASMIVMTNAAQSAAPQVQSKLVFNRYGDRYFLSQIWVAGSETGKQLPKSSREKEIATEAKLDTRDAIHPTQVILVASR
jgi:hypothetical protein